MISILIGYFSDCWIVVSALLNKKNPFCSLPQEITGGRQFLWSLVSRLGTLFPRWAYSFTVANPDPPAQEAESCCFHICAIQCGRSGIFRHKRFSDPGSNKNKREEEEILNFLTFFRSNKFDKFENSLIFEQVWKKIVGWIRDPRLKKTYLWVKKASDPGL